MDNIKEINAENYTVAIEEASFLGSLLGNPRTGKVPIFKLTDHTPIFTLENLFESSLYLPEKMEMMSIWKVDNDIHITHNDKG